MFRIGITLVQPDSKSEILRFLDKNINLDEVEYLEGYSGSKASLVIIEARDIGRV